MVDISQAELRDDRSTERLVDLAMFLQKSARGYTRDEIGKNVPHYNTSDADNFGLMFERDKVELISIGFDIEVNQADEWNQDEFRYRIVPSANILPALDFTEAEMRVLVQATQAWRQTTLSDDANQTKLKLESLGVSTSEELPLAEFSASSDLRVIAHGIATRRVIKFEYRKPGEQQSHKRNLEPWGMALRAGSWYVYGYDKDREEERCFNLSRVVSSISTSGKADAFAIPQQIDVEILLNPDRNESSDLIVTLRVAEGAGNYWRSRAMQPCHEFDATEIMVQLQVPRLQIPKLAGDAPGVIVLAPDETRMQVIDLIRGAQ